MIFGADHIPRKTTSFPSLFWLIVILILLLLGSHGIEETRFLALILGSAMKLIAENWAGSWIFVLPPDTTLVLTCWRFILWYASSPKGCPGGILGATILTMRSCDLMLRLATEHASNNNRIKEVVLPHSNFIKKTIRNSKFINLVTSNSSY